MLTPNPHAKVPLPLAGQAFRNRSRPKLESIMPVLHRIAIYPLKSFDPLLVDESLVLPGGGLEHDRQFAFVDASGRFVNGKRTPLVHRLEVHLNPKSRTLRTRDRLNGPINEWRIDDDRDAIHRWFSDYFSLDVTLVEDSAHGFPDDLESPGPTVVSQATLLSVADWFPGLDLDQTRLRFRANLELSDSVAFWEDRLCGSEAETAIPFRIGNVSFAGTNPCQRCVVPTRDPLSGEVWPEFARRFGELRSERLPDWAPRQRFNHFYRLTVNTRLLDRGEGIIRVGDPVELVHLDP